MNFLSKISIVMLIAAAFIFLAINSYAELTTAEKEVIEFVNMVHEMAYTGENTEGIPHDKMMEFSNENIKNMAKTYKISLDDVSALEDSVKNNKPMPITYKPPSVPVLEEKKWLVEEYNKSLFSYSKYAKKK